MTGSSDAQKTFWLSEQPLILASRSQARIALLRSAHIPVESMPSEVDERALELDAVSRGRTPSEIALLLSKAKAIDVSQRTSDRIVVGADQILSLAGGILHKPKDKGELNRRLHELSGKTHVLYSGMAISLNSKIIYEGSTDKRGRVRTRSRWQAHVRSGRWSV